MIERNPTLISSFTVIDHGLELNYTRRQEKEEVTSTLELAPNVKQYDTANKHERKH